MKTLVVCGCRDTDEHDYHGPCCDGDSYVVVLQFSVSSWLAARSAVRMQRTVGDEVYTR